MFPLHPDSTTTEIVLFVVGTLISIIGAFGVFILRSIRDQIGDLKDGIKELNDDLREGVTGLDRRVTHVEAHLGFDSPGRRKTNGKSH